MDLPKSIAVRIRELRMAKRWSQERLAEEAGLSMDAISRIERGERDPRLETVAQIARALGIALPKLLKFGGPPLRSSKAKDDLTRSGEEEILDAATPELAEALIKAIRSVLKVPPRARRHKRSNAAAKGRAG
jgi:transcriptional regulator with XRE-family HTH domain